MRPRPLVLTGLALAAAAVPARAQGYRLVLDGRMQQVAFRGWQPDSVLRTTVGAGPGGGFISPDGFAVQCRQENWCQFFRPGQVQNSLPVAGTADLTMWGVGIRGVRLHAMFRAAADAGDAPYRPAAQLFEGYAEYQSGAFTGRLGRQTFASRLGFTGFDGAQASYRFGDGGMFEATAYGGLGLAPNMGISIGNVNTVPLGDFAPPSRQLVAGAMVGMAGRNADLKLEYQRQVDRDARKLFGERAALSGSVRPFERWSVTGGAWYDLVTRQVGTAELSLRYGTPTVQLSAFGRRYQPWFDLWQIWMAFNPAANEGVGATATVQALPGVSVRGRAEAFRFEIAGGDSPLVRAEREGWRWATGVLVTQVPRWTFDAGAVFERGPGAAGRSFDASVSWRPRDELAVRTYGSRLDRPLEYRFNDARVTWAGLELDWTVNRTLAVGGGLVRLWETRARPDAAAFDWAQTRAIARVTLLLDSGGADRLDLPRATRRMPSTTRFGQ
ncbi:MAG: hypothetical protein NW201_04255 [Gemmatimonadales bacterium]|nr:hypothetical protein [Gemmatimonadales bacterium]